MTDAHDRQNAAAHVAGQRGTTKPIAGRVLVLSALAALALACDQVAPTAPDEPGKQVPAFEDVLPEGTVVLNCTASVAAASVTCASPAPSATPGNALIVGGQDVNVLLASAETDYDGDTGIFGTSVTVQNLTRHVMGTPDGATVEGVRVFFHGEPMVTSGTGTVTVANADGHDIFTGTLQPFFAYADALAPLAVSDGKRWEFAVGPTVNAFDFSVFVSAPIADEGAALLGSVWNGAAGSDWLDAANWNGGEAPDSASAVSIPSLALLEPGAALPVLTVEASVLHLRVGLGSVLALDGHTLHAHGNVDVVGEIADGTLVVEGEDVIVGGALPAVEVAGSASLQKPVTTSGAVAVTGSLVVNGAPLTITVP